MNPAVKEDKRLISSHNSINMFDNQEVKNDYYLACLSRELSIIGRKEVLSGRAKFGIFGDGKEVAQIALAKCFKAGDWRSGYYRDQTFMMATGMCKPEEFFSMLYGNTDTKLNPHTAGRSFNNHFGTRYIDEWGHWLPTVNRKNSSSDVSPTSAQMPRLLGLAYASKIYRELKEWKESNKFSNNGDEVAFGTIGDASTSEGHFWEVLNAAAVLQVPLALAVWDDGYGISVPTEVQTVKGSISEALQGFQKEENKNGIYIYRVKGWDYVELCKTFAEGVDRCRKEHVPVVFHVTELTQPQGHSTSGSHERYKSAERLAWEAQYDANVKMKEWMLKNNIVTIDEINAIEQKAAHDAQIYRQNSFKQFIEPILNSRSELIEIIEKISCICNQDNIDKINNLVYQLKSIQYPIRKDVLSTARKVYVHLKSNCKNCESVIRPIKLWIDNQILQQVDNYSSHLYCEHQSSALYVEKVDPKYSNNSPIVYAREIIRDNFDVLFSKYPNLIAIGEDIGKIGGVNQTYEGLQQKYGQHRITDTSIREASIVGQGIGMAMRGLKVIAEIQYLDYLLFSLQTLSDDLATLSWRTKGGQAAPLIVSTRGHRLEGVWHSGSPMSTIINALRGMYICVPRNMTQAAGFYNTLLQANDPALVIEPLNGYRLKEQRPDNIGEYTIPLGIPEIVHEGNDVTLVTYGSCVRIAQEAVHVLHELNVSVELIDVQTLIPFDIHEIIKNSIQKTGLLVLVDEDVPGGATGYMMHKIVEVQKAWPYLKKAPKTITAMEHRPAYTSDGDYFSKPNAEDIIEMVYEYFNN